MLPTPPHLLSRRTALAALAAAGTAPAFGLAGGCAQAPPPVRPAGAFDAWAEGVAADWMRMSPERATVAQYFSGAEQDALDTQLSERGAARRERERTRAREDLAALERHDPAQLTTARRAAAGTLRFGLQRVLDEAPFEELQFPFDQLGGLHVQLVRLLTQVHPLRRPSDLETWLARLRGVPERIDDGIARARAGAARGLLPPRVIAERAQAQITAFLAPAPAQNVFVAALAERSAAMPGLAPEARHQAIAEATARVEAQVRPAYARVGALLDDLLPRTGSDVGLWRLPGGAAAYAQALAGHITTTALDPEAVHAIGLREVARIEAEMDVVLRRLGRSEGSVRARTAAVGAANQVPTEPDPRPALLAMYTQMVRDAEGRSGALFNLRPAAPVEVRRVPALTERTSSAYYTQPAPDGSRPGIFWVPLPGPTFSTVRMRSLAHHEAVPGHHFQLAIQQETASLPRWRQLRVFGGGSAHSEGWALYAEKLAIEAGWFDGDDVGLLGAWDSLLFRARRLVVDTGLHARRWTREQAIAYGIPAQEVERYIVNPGQACAYMIGMLRIVAERDKVRAALGARFSLKDFHDVVLQTGSVPLDVLAEVIDAWVARSAG